MIKVAIIEDEPAVYNEIVFLLKDEPDLEIIGPAHHVSAAVELLQEQLVDVVLMDIQLIDGTAFDVLKNVSPVPENIIFITAFNQFAIKAIKYGALDYLLKPIDQQELKEALDRYRQKQEKNLQYIKQLELARNTFADQHALPEQIVLNSLNNIRVINVQDILYCKGDGPYTFFHLKNGKNELVSKPLKYYEDLLPSPYFVRSHQSYLVNRSQITGIIRSEYLVLQNEEQIPVSSRRKSYVLNLLSLK
ncbi:LytTR family DNA-binding domain-containing protein [Chryseobacterium sp. NRRL B-14859]|uniref:LytR/AlgR family response regulator transcription factor n=1 Tax=unclassified Chryseobacterium TaxID=2593645 RepID=UPI000F45DC1D|nr:LytTR family DNA-binding domain-containing protein [Chryseobacterium sp. G0240]ROI03277.1 DNA-binding response regulator [Chryseobacterium sp. G0240]